MASITYTILSGCYREEEGRRRGRREGREGEVNGGEMGIGKEKGVEEKRKEAGINRKKTTTSYGAMHSGESLLWDPNI